MARSAAPSPARPARPTWAAVLDVVVGAVGVLVSVLVAWTCGVLTGLLQVPALVVVTTVLYVFVTALGLGFFLVRAVQRRRAWWWPWAATLVCLAVFYASAAIAGAVLT